MADKIKKLADSGQCRCKLFFAGREAIHNVNQSIFGAQTCPLCGQTYCYVPGDKPLSEIDNPAIFGESNESPDYEKIDS